MDVHVGGVGCCCICHNVTSRSFCCSIALCRLAPLLARLSRGKPRVAAIETGVSLLGLVEPDAIGVFAHHTHGDRHVGMAVAAKLGTLSVVDALALGPEPHLVQA